MEIKTYDDLVNPEIFKNIKLYVAGVGNGGSSLVNYLLRSGFSNMILNDFDNVEVRNLYGHLCDASDVGKSKVSAVKSTLLKRNDKAKIKTTTFNFMETDSWKKDAESADIILIATDNMQTRFLLNEFAIKHEKPLVVGKVFHEGIGGEVFTSIPNVTGCLNCLEEFLSRIDRNGISIYDHMSEEEKQDIYSKDIDDIKNEPGLYLDMSFIPLLMARKVLEVAYYLTGNIKDFKKIPNYLIWSNHAVPPFKKALHLEKFFLDPQDKCLACNERNKDEL